MTKKHKQNLPKNRSKRKKYSETIVIEGKTYMRMYDEDGGIPEYLSSLNLSEDGIEEVVEELKEFGLMEVIEHNGVEYCRLLEPIER